MMAFSFNFSRTFRSKKLLQMQMGKLKRNSYVPPIRYHRILMRNISSLENSKRAIKAVIILSYKPRQQEQLYEKDVLMTDTDGDNFINLILTVARIFVIGSVASMLAIAYFVTRFTQRRIFPIILLKSIEFLGPIFVKFGQWASTRRDLFPEELCRTLSQLQRSACPHSWMYTKQLLKAVYGANWSDVFVKFERDVPIGSGCCAQVYKAWIDLNTHVERSQKPHVSPFIQIIEYFKIGSIVDFMGKTFSDNDDDMQFNELCTNGKLRSVAVKVLHPGIKGQLKRDLFIMKGICKCATYIAPRLQWLSLTDCIDEFSQIMKDQVNLNAEASNLLQFSKNFSHNRDVIFPRPYTKFTQSEVLVESFHEGIPISDYLDDHDTKLQGKLAKIGIKTILQMIFRDNFIHCDLHPGNILVQKNCKSSGRLCTWFWKFVNPNYLPGYPRLIILDCGLVVSLNKRCRQNLKDVFRSVAIGDGELAAEYILEHSSCTSPDAAGFKNTLRNIVDKHLATKNKVEVSTVVSELFSAMIQHRVKQDGSFSSVILSMAVIEGLGRSLDPNIDIFAEVVPFVFADNHMM